MKKYIAIFLLSMIAFSCKETSKLDGKLGTIKTTTLSQIKTFDELIKDVPKDYNTIEFELMAKCDGKLRVETCTSNELSDGAKELLKLAQIGSKVYIDLKINNDTTTVRGYHLLVSE